jgi:hypothetical protein
MPYEIKGRLSLKIYFEGIEFPFERANSLDFLHISSSTRTAVPMLHFRLIDTVEYFSNSKFLADGTRITLVMNSADSPKSNTVVFRLNSYKKPLIAAGSGYEFDAYLDVPVFWHASQTNSITSTSSGALQELATICGLSMVTQNTVDTQTWIPRNIPYFEWARQIAERGYRSERSCMQLALTPNKELRYRDLSDTPALSGGFVFPNPKSGYFSVTDFQPKSNSGTMNHQTAYQEKRVVQSAVATNPQEDLSSIGVTKVKAQDKLFLNSSVKNSVKQSRVRFSPIDAGNVHPNYERALYQNRRLSNLFTNVIEIVTPEATSLDALDYVSLSLDFDLPASPALYNGNYWVSAKAIYIQGNNYYEKFELSSNTIRNNSGTAL